MSIRKGNSIISGTDTGDGKSITRNSGSQLQSVGVIDQNNTTNALKYWTGTKAQYDEISVKDENTLYNITDDIGDSIGIRNIGQIITSTIPLEDAGLHLLDGSLLAYGSYKAFIDYIESIYDASSNYFCSEADWQTSVTTYGVCGKFVYNSTNRTVRLPKYSNKIFTQNITQSTAPVVGNGKTLGLTNGTKNVGLVQRNDGDNNYSCVRFQETAYGASITNTAQSGQANVPGIYGVTSDPTKSGLIAQLSDITTSLDGYYYIVVATSTKTDIEVDIDEVATDLNGKADVDLTNVTNSANIKMAHNAMPSNKFINLTLGASGTTYTAPANGYFYLNKVAGSDWYYVRMKNAISNIDLFVDGYRTSPLTSVIPAKKGENVYVYYNATGTTNQFRFIYAQGSESEAQ